MSLNYSEHKERIIRALNQMREPGWKPVVNLRTRLCSVFIGAQHPDRGFEGMITDRRQARPTELDEGQRALLNSIGWKRPESSFVKAPAHCWPVNNPDAVAHSVLQTLTGVYDWFEDEPLWIHHTFKRKPNASLDVDQLLHVLDKYTVIFIKPNIYLRQARAWSACTSAFNERRCDVVLHVPAGRHRRLTPMHGERLATPPSSKTSINYLLHPEAPSPDWLANFSRPS